MKTLNSKMMSGALAAALALSLAGCEGMMSTASSLEAAQNAFDHGQYRIANAHLIDLLEHGQTGADVRKLQLQLMLKMNDGNRAIAALEQLSEEEFGGVDRRVALAHAQILQGSPQKTTAIYEPLLEEDYTEQDFRMLLWALHDMGESEDFAAGMDYALERYPTNPYLNALAADQLYDFDLPEEAAKFADMALENGPDVLEAQLVTGRKAIYAGELEEAITHYKRAHEINPMAPLPLTNVAGLHMDLGQLDEAGEVLKVALDNYGDYPFLQWQLARYKLATGDLQGAREAKDRVERVFGDDMEFVLLMAEIEAALGNKRLALDSYRKFVRGSGEVPEIMQKIAELEG